MGKRKRGRQSRKEKRARAIGREAEIALRESRDAKKSQYLSNDLLFQVDSAPNSKLKRLIKNEQARDEERKARDERERLLSASSTSSASKSVSSELGPRARARREARARRNRRGGRKNAAAERASALNERGKKARASVAATGGAYDVWGDEKALPWERSKQKKEERERKKLGLSNHLISGHREREAAPRRRPKKSFRSTEYRVPAVQVPIGGLSYNPDREAHQDAIALAVANERERLRQTVVEIKRHHVGESMIDADVEESSSSDEDEETVLGNEPVRCTRLTRQQRARRRLAASEKKAAQTRRERKQRGVVDASTASLGRITAAIGEESKTAQAIKDAAAARKAKRKRQREERYDFEPSLIRGGKKVKEFGLITEVPLTSELSSRLRDMKSQGNVAEDRFTSLLRRNKFERGSKQHNRKTKKKVKQRD